MALRPFRIDIPDGEVADLRSRLAATRWPDQLPDAAWRDGTDLDYLSQLVRHWAGDYDWRRHEADLNELPQFLTTLGGQQVHLVHARSPEPDALPLVLTHGWPGSFVEFARLIGPLTDPRAHGGDPADAFHVVVPSLPGYGFSGPTTEHGWDVRRIAEAWAELMDHLGYERYGAQGGDWGSMVSRHLADIAGDRVVGVHLNMIVTAPPGRDDDLADLTEREAAALERMQEYQRTGSGYVAIQSTRPQTLGYALTDSPAGLLAWIAEKFWAWTDHHGNPEDAVRREDLLTNTSIYWFTRTATSSTRLYYESLRSGAARAPDVTVPLGVANFPAEIVTARRRWVEASNNLVHWSEMDRGGHFAALEAPDLLVEDIRTFFSGLG